jgi:hypothetical protein
MYFSTMIKFFISFFLLLGIISCAQPTSEPVTSFVHHKLTIFNAKGNVDFAFLDRIWQYGDSYIEEVNTMKSVTAYKKNSLHEKETTTWQVPEFYRYIKPSIGYFTDYHSLTDTATKIKEGAITDSIRKDGGWGFWANHIVNFNYLSFLPDTVADNKTYKRIRFYFYTQDTTKVYSVAWLEPAAVLSPFSIEKNYCKEHGYNNFKIVDYAKRTGQLYAITEVVKIADTLTPEIKRIFKKWN